MSARRQANGNSESVDNYLKAILSLGGEGSARVASKPLAERLGVAPASVTNMLQKLAAAAAPLVEYERHRGGPAFVDRAAQSARSAPPSSVDRDLLYEVLDYPLEEVHDEAERLEHFISERFEERIAAKLGHPKIDPHGHAIPTMEGEMAARESVPLTDVVGDGVFVIDSVSDRDARHLRLIEACGITPGATLRVRKSRVTESYSVSIGRSSKAFDLSAEVAGDVRVLPGAKR